MSKRSSAGGGRKATNRRSSDSKSPPVAKRPRGTFRRKLLVVLGFIILIGGALVVITALILVSLLPGGESLLSGNQVSSGENSVPLLITIQPVIVDSTATSLPPTDEPTKDVTDEPTLEALESDEALPPTEDGLEAAFSLVPDIQPTPDAVFREGKVPVLMYHYISESPDEQDAIRISLSVPPEEFEKQMAWLYENGWTAITFYDFIQWLENGEELPEKPVILTFDDGYRDNYENAFPVLQEYDMVGTFFVLTGVTGTDNPQYVTWDMLREMAEAGQSIEMHAHDHLDLDNRAAAFLNVQMVQSADILEEQLGYRPRFFAYPGGNYDESTIEALKDAGYWMAVTTQFGWLHSSGQEYELKRVRIHGEYSLGQFSGIMRAVFDEQESAS